MKATLEFDRLEEEEMFIHALKGADYHAVLYDFYYNTIRKRTKYCEHPECCHKLLETIKDEFFDELKTRDIEI